MLTNGRQLGKTLYHQGDLSYFEAVNKEALKNAYSRFEEEGIIVITKSPDSSVKVSVRVASDWTIKRDTTSGDVSLSGRLWDFTERIARSRREGKQRRDGVTVSSRVISMASRLGVALYQDNEAQTVPATIEGAGASSKAKKFRRRSRL